MNDLILELLQSRGGMTVDHLALTLGVEAKDAENALQALRKEGKARQDQGTISKWHDDRCFKCKHCRASFPKVRRFSRSPICFECYYIKYKPDRNTQTLRVKKPKNADLFSRFDEFWIGPHWAGQRSQEILTKQRLSA